MRAFKCVFQIVVSAFPFLIPIVVLAFPFLVSSAMNAHAQAEHHVNTTCSPVQVVHDLLKNNHSESPRVLLGTNGANKFIIYASLKGTWTMVVEAKATDGVQVLCFMGSGKNFHVANPPAEKKEKKEDRFEL